MRHLYVSRVEVERMTMTSVNGMPRMGWKTLEGVYVDCRLDLNFVRPGKDQPMAISAGQAPDRMGVMFCDAEETIRAGDRITAIPNDEGVIVVPGTFEIRVMPDVATDYSSAHHIEVQVIEVAQAIAASYGRMSGTEAGS